MDYVTISKELLPFHFAEDISFSHGLLCGYIIVKPELELVQWLDEILLEYDSNIHSLAPLQVLFNQTLEHLSNAQLDFALLIDTRAPKEELETLIQWSCGFLYGLGLGGVDANADEVGEIIHSIINISQIDSNIDGTSEDENDIFELVEFVRIAVLLMQEYINPDTINSVSLK